ncbi:PKD domain-containing protein [Pinibacter aurantiacus]|uniref:PKD domain-containing protein n=1 Tax=Pinibacter aurantiacus TaxID=2851599 RepID=A0A9E2SAU4_9BACT|nr:PKD domain-containing protein [Pinibacter aurantiacus]MBV4357050.1 PKD domain-containing protein [Pinibacter aurantiacus]
MRQLVFLLVTIFSSQLQAQQTIENNISAIVDCNNRTAFTFSDTDPHDEWQLVEWNFGDGTSVNEMPVAASIAHIYSNPNSATYVVSVKKKNVITQQISTATRTVFVVNEEPSFSADVLETCLQNKVTFVPVGIKSQFINKYQWDFGDGKITVKTNTKLSPKFDASISYTFDDPGAYNVKLAIADTNGCSRSFECPTAIHIKGPVAKFKATSVTSCKEENFTRTIKDASVPDKTTAINKWEWYVWESGSAVPARPTMIFDNAHPMSAGGVVFPFSNIVHAYKGYSVKLIVTDNEGCISAAKTSSSYIKSYWPKAAFEAGKTLLCNENDAQLNDASSGNKLDYTWSYGDGETGSTSVSHSHTFINDGLYSVKLTVAEKQMNTCKDEVVKDDYIKIVNVKAAFEMSDIRQCAPVPVSFTDHSINAASYNWDFGDGAVSTESQPAHTFEAGDQSITLTVKSPGNECASSAAIPLHAYQKPNVSIEGNEVVCLKKNVTALAYRSEIKGNDAPTAYEWKLDGAPTSNEARFINDCRQPGAHNITLTVNTSEHCAGSAEKNIKIDSVVSSFTFDNTNHCVENNSVVFKNNSTSFYPAIFDWSFGDGIASGDFAPQHTYAASGEYATMLTTKTPYCSAIFPGEYKVVIYNNPSIEISGDQNVCVGVPVDFTLLNKGNDVLTKYVWYVDGGEASATNSGKQQYKFDQVGSVKIAASVTSLQGCSANAPAVNVNVKPYPVLDETNAYTVKSGDVVVLKSGTNSDNLQHNWSPQTGLSCYECASPVFNSTASIQYHLAVSTPEGCAVEKDIVVTVIKDIDVPVNNPCPGITMPNAFTPNGDGQNEVFYVKGCSISFVKKLSIYDKFGRCVFMRENFLPNDKQFGWDGKVNGVTVSQTDTFVYIAEFVDKQGKTQSLKGTVLLLK